ncbi:MAG: AbrB/MazE/SpoVT family DNA-binding domain-containing protein [Actinobacteria bacterium]|nr:MAG: AbrB/MazE/SpoVT family DNA-binding domain-containing protein [Actinomycetota bacterium]
MRDTGIVRKLDALGRIVIPMELRRTFGIDTGDPIRVFVDGDRIVLQKHEASCVFCGTTEGVGAVLERAVCTDCLAAIKKG